MYYYEVIPNKVFRAGSEALTYEFPNKIAPGTLVLIPVGRKSLPGLILKSVKKPDFPTKPITKVLYDTPLSPHLISASIWLSSYYLAPLPVALQTLLPKGVEKARRKSPDTKEYSSTSPSLTLPPLNTAQKTALKSLLSCPSKTVLLHGITGSGKTLIYMHLAKKNLKEGKSTILLVPEIALTSQLITEFNKFFPNTILLHSKQTEAERHLLWEKILKTNSPSLIIGPRSALFAPVKSLGLVIIDEAHEPAYRQDQNPKYSALRLASVMSPKVILGTATPLVTDYYLAKKRSALVDLKETAVKSDKTSKISVIDLKNRDNFKKHRLISDSLLSSIENSLKAKKLSLIFHNRRGSAPMTICDHCGWQALCPNCFLPLTLHADRYTLLCHTCGAKVAVPTSCPDCKNPNILHKGIGTKLLESELGRLFPDARIARFDADTESSVSLEKQYKKITSGDFDIIIGTQMLAKGFDFKNLTTLGVVQADAGLSLPDFSSEERTYQLLTQVIGRATRGHQNTNIFIQTYQPDHPVIEFATKNDYDSLCPYILNSRKIAALPPFSYLAQLTLTYKTEEACIRNIKKLANQITVQASNAQKGGSPSSLADCAQGVTTPAQKRGRRPVTTGATPGASARLEDETPCPIVQVSKPTPAFHERTNQGYSWQLILKSPSRTTLLKTLKSLPPNPHLHISLDPYTLL